LDQVYLPGKQTGEISHLADNRSRGVIFMARAVVPCPGDQDRILPGMGQFDVYVIAVYL